MLQKIVFATHNKGKIAEVRRIFEDVNGLTIVSAEEAGVMEDVVEDGLTFASNALKKARFVGYKTNEWTMADDSGICVDVLEGAPGIYSARWAGEGAPGHKWVELLLSKMQNSAPEECQRTARFETMAVLFNPDGGEAFFFKGEVRGRIALKPRGVPHPKLPYDSVFIPDGYTKTFSEMLDKKNELSHRGQAFAKLKEFIQRL